MGTPEGGLRVPSDAAGWNRILEEALRFAEAEGVRLGLSPAARDEVYGRMVFELLNAKRGRPGTTQSSGLHLLATWRARDVARTHRWNQLLLAEEPALLVDVHLSEHVDAARSMRAVRQAMLRIDPQETKVLLERYWCGMTYAEVARSCGDLHHEQGRRRIQAAEESLSRALAREESPAERALDRDVTDLIERADCRRACPRRWCHLATTK